jgi:ACS family glucarate transporter-like MFS transporter
MKEKFPWPIVLLLCFTATAGYICRVNISTAGALVMKDLNLSQVDMGRLFSAFILGYALFQIPTGALADRFGTKKVLLIATWLWVILTILQSIFGWSYFGITVSSLLTIFLVLRFFLGITASPTYPASAAGISRWVPKQFQGRANGIVIGSVGLGSALAPIIVSSIMVRWGWQMALIVSSIPAFLVAIIWSKKTKEEQVTIQHISTEKSETSNLKKLDFYLLTISYTLQGYVGYIFVSWFYLYLVQERGFNLLTGAWMSSLPWILSIISIPFGGYLADRLIKGRLGLKWGGRIVPMIGMAASGVLISIGAHTQSAILAAITLAFATAFILCVEGPFWSTMIRIAKNRSGTVGGIMNMGSNFGGFISPIATPWLATFIGWEAALHLAGGLAIIAALLWLGIRSSD